MSKELTQLKKLNRDEDKEAVQRVVSDHVPHLTAAALAAALGSTVLMKLANTPTGRMKYIPVTDPEEIIQGLEWLSAHGNHFDAGDGGFFILQQRPPDAKFWDALVNRHLGKIPDEAKIDLTHKLDLAAVGRKALTTTKTEEEAKYEEPIPSSWLSM